MIYPSPNFWRPTWATRPRSPRPLPHAVDHPLDQRAVGDRPGRQLGRDRLDASASTPRTGRSRDTGGSTSTATGTRTSIASPSASGSAVPSTTGTSASTLVTWTPAAPRPRRRPGRRPAGSERPRRPRPRVGDRRRRGRRRHRTAPAGHLRRLHRVRPEPDVHRGLHARRGAAALYANTHTESSGTGLQTTRFREEARADRPSTGRRRPTITRCIFCGSGSTGCHRQARRRAQPPAPGRPRRPLRTLRRTSRPTSGRSCSSGRYEHHSNELPWRESIADVVTIHEDARRAHRPRAARRRARSATPTDRCGSAPSRRPRTSPGSSPTPARSRCLLHRARRALVLGLRGRRAVRARSR